MIVISYESKLKSYVLKLSI